jgi:hypothetical protein
MQRIVSTNDMNDPGQEQVVFDAVTREFLTKAFNVLRRTDAIVITGSCVTAHTLLAHSRNGSFVPGDIDVFVKQDPQIENSKLDRYYVQFHLLNCLQGIHSQPRLIPVKISNFNQYNNCKINILEIMEFDLRQDLENEEDPAVHSRPKIQIIVVMGDECPIPQEFPSSSLTPFERKVVTSFDLDIVQGIYNPLSNQVTFAHDDTKCNILKKEFWYLWDAGRSCTLSSVFERVNKYRERGFVWRGFKDMDDPEVAIILLTYQLSQPQLLVPDLDFYTEDNGPLLLQDMDLNREENGLDR